jgi:2-polyprenyl-6-methoxyphenol hydroxylase-like FAD-dependent oxidoreductase
VRIVDKTAEPDTTSRALAVQARTLELYRQLGLADAVLEHGHKVPAVNLWVKGEPAARLPFESVGSDLTPYPFLQCPASAPMRQKRQVEEGRISGPS